MRIYLMSSAALLLTSIVLLAQGPAPAWAYGYLTPAVPGGPSAPACADARPISCAYPAGPAVADDGIRLTLPDTKQTFTFPQIAFDYGPADWYPGDHPTMPDIVARGRQQDGLRACGLCHYPNGKGKMENGGVAGLPVSYILKQLADFKNGVRKSSDPRKANTNEMVLIAKSLTENEAKVSAEYFASLKWTSWVKVKESATTPKVRASINGLFLPLADGSTEPLGQRIMEMPEIPERTDKYRDPRSGFVAYVPMGSLAKGEDLVKTGGAKCGTCHGADFKGTATVPGLAGRSPSYTMRQLWDMQQGTRTGSVPMKNIVAQLSVDDMIAITAYLSAQAP